MGNLWLYLSDYRDKDGVRGVRLHHKQVPSFLPQFQIDTCVTESETPHILQFYFLLLGDEYDSLFVSL
jgi:hypothetical protein